MTRFALVCLWLALSAAVWCQQAASAVGESLTLEQAVAMALKNNRMVKNAELEIQKADEEIAITRTNRLPSFNLNVLEAQLFTHVDFTFPAGAWGVYPATGPIPGANIPIRTARRPATFVLARATQPLSQLPRIGLGIKLRELQRDVAREKLRATQQTTVTEVKKAYYAILQIQSGLVTTDRAIRLAKELDRVVGEGVAQQAVLKSESLEVKSRLARFEYDAASLGYALASQKEQLNDLLGRDTSTEFTVVALPDSPASPAALAEARTRALADRPEVREARIRVRQAEHDRSMKKSEFIPEISLMFGYLSPFNIEVVPKNVAMGGFLLSWDLWDWGRKKREMVVKTKTIEQARNALEETEAQVLVEVDGRHRRMEDARRLLNVVRMAQDAAQEKVRIATNQYKQQAVLLKDVLQTQTSLAEVDHQYQQALLSFLTAKSELEKAVGETETK